MWLGSVIMVHNRWLIHELIIWVVACNV